MAVETSLKVSSHIVVDVVGHPLRDRDPSIRDAAVLSRALFSREKERVEGGGFFRGFS